MHSFLTWATLILRGCRNCGCFTMEHLLVLHNVFRTVFQVLFFHIPPVESILPVHMWNIPPVKSMLAVHMWKALFMTFFDLVECLPRSKIKGYSQKALKFSTKIQNWGDPIFFTTLNFQEGVPSFRQKSVRKMSKLWNSIIDYKLHESYDFQKKNQKK